jgi:uncharacterized protein YrrD
VKASDVIGRQITARGGGQVIGKVRDLVIDQAGRVVIGIVLSDAMFSGSRVAPWKAVQAFGPDSVVIDVAGSVVKAVAAPEIKAVLDKKTRIKGLRLVTTQGKELGKIVDIDFDETTGDVRGYELSGGLFSDAFSGTPVVPTPDSLELGKDVAFVAPEVESTIVPSGGLRSALKRGDKAMGPLAGSAPVAPAPVVPAFAEPAMPAPAPAEPAMPASAPMDAGSDPSPPPTSSSV